MNLFRLIVITVSLSFSNLWGLVIDSFQEGAVSLSSAPFGLSGITTSIESPIGSLRTIILTRPGLLDEGDEITADVNVDAATLTFSSYNPSPPPNYASVGVYYRADSSIPEGVFDLSDYNAFIFDFSQMEGTGLLHIEIGSSDGYNPSQSITFPLTEAGLITVPFDFIEFNYASLSSFDTLSLMFIADSPSFSFTLDEIAVTSSTVPEPSSYAAILGSLGLLMAATRRRHSSSISS